jgi:hypothetical protein
MSPPPPHASSPPGQVIQSLEAKIAQLRDRVDQLTAQVALLEKESVRQCWDGSLVFPVWNKVHITVGSNELALEYGRLSLSSSGCINLSGSVIKLAAGRVDADTALAQVAGTVDCDTLRARNILTPVAGDVIRSGTGNAFSGRVQTGGDGPVRVPGITDGTSNTLV